MFTRITQQQMPEPMPIPMFEPFTWKEMYEASLKLNINKSPDNNGLQAVHIHLVFMTLSKSLISQLTGAVISLTGLLFDLTMTSIENLLLQTHLNQTTIALNPTSIFQSKSLLPYTGLLGTLLTLTAHHLLLNFPVFQSFHLLKMQTSSVTFCAVY